MDSFGRQWTLAAYALLLAFAPAAEAACVDAPDLASYQDYTAADFALGPTESDRLGRVVAPVMVNGLGPFRFIVDTGANRSVLSTGLADNLQLTPEGTGQVHSVHGVSTAPLVQVDSLRYGDLSLSASNLPILSGAVLAGEHGLLGVDGMRGRRLRMDFERNCIEIIPSQGAPRLGGWAVIRGELRFGHLVVIEGSINGVRVKLFVDTGSDTTLANSALRDALNARLRSRQRVNYVVAHAAGERVVLQHAIFIPRMRLGELEVRNITAYVGDFHIFQLWELVDEPALLIGMDVLTQARGLAIDYERARVYLDVRDPLEIGTRLRDLRY